MVGTSSRIVGHTSRKAARNTDARNISHPTCTQCANNSDVSEMPGKDYCTARKARASEKCPGFAIKTGATGDVP